MIMFVVLSRPPQLSPNCIGVDGPISPSLDVHSTLALHHFTKKCINRLA